MLQRGLLRIGGKSDNERWQYVGKFGYMVGEGSVSGRLRLPRSMEHQPASIFGAKVLGLQMQVFLDEDWDKVESLAPCARASDGPARTNGMLSFNETGEWGDPRRFPLRQFVRSHIWYFALSDCEGNFGNTTITLEYEIHSLQADGSELSVEARYMPAAESVALAGLTAFVVHVAARCRSFHQSAGALHPVIWALAAATAMQYVSQALHLVHIIWFASDGVGFWTLDVMAEILFMACQIVYAALLIAIARGYTLLPMKESEYACTKLGFVTTLAAHAALVGFGKVQEGTSSRRHHENDGVLGWVIVVIRLSLLLYFLVAVGSTKQRGGSRLEHFLAKFTLAGTLYFTAYPLVFLLAQAFAPYLRHPIMQLGLLAMQSLVVQWLSNLFLTRGAYFKVSALGAGLLPGGGATNSSSCTLGGLASVGFQKDD